MSSYYINSLANYCFQGSMGGRSAGGFHEPCPGGGYPQLRSGGSSARISSGGQYGDYSSSPGYYPGYGCHGTTGMESCSAGNSVQLGGFYNPSAGGSMNDLSRHIPFVAGGYGSSLIQGNGST